VVHGPVRRSLKTSLIRSFYTEWLWMRMALRQEQHLLRESINKRRAKEGEDPIKLEPRKVAKEIASALGGPFAR